MSNSVSGLVSFYQRNISILRPLKEAVYRIPGGQKLARKVLARGARKSSNPVLSRFDNDIDAALDKLITLSNAEAITLFEEALIYCRETVQYDRLKVVMEIFGDWAEQRNDLGTKSTIAFLEIYEFAFKNLNGRVVSRIPEMDVAHLPTGRVLERAFTTYFYLLTSNLEYDRANAALSSIKLPFDAHFLYRLAVSLKRKPVRVEVNTTDRVILKERIIRQLRDALESSGWTQAFSDTIVASIDDFSNVALHDVTEALKGLGAANLKTSSARALSSLLTSLLSKVLQHHGAIAAIETLSLSRSWMEPAHIADFELRIAATHSDEQALIDRSAGPQAHKAYALLSTLAWDRNDFREALEYARRIPTGHFSLGKSLQYTDTIDRLSFLAETSDWLAKVDQPERPNGVVLLASLNCYNTLAMVTPALIEMKRRGFAVGSLMSGVLNQRPPENMHPELGSLFNCIHRNREDGQVSLAWEVDWSERRVMCGGINYYQGIYERLSTIYRRATIFIEEEPIASTFMSLLKRCDYVLRACQKVEAAAENSEAPIILLGSNSHVAPYSVIRDFCLGKSLPNLRYVTCNVAYENYYSNLGGKYSRSMAVVDMTLHRECRAPFLAIKSRFDRWYTEFGRSDAVRERFDNLLSANRSGKAIGSDDEIGRTIQTAREEGRKVVCCFGKILCDLSVPYDGGPAHLDMIDWINHSINIAAKHPNDILLLIKPHPHELRPEIALELTEQLRDVCPPNLPENVVFLGHRDFNIGDLAPMLDTAVLWNGTSSLELTGLGVPVVMAAHFGRHDYPLDLIYPSSRTDYETLLTEPLPAPNEDLRWRAMALLHYMGTKDVAIPNEYSLRPITNDRVGIPSWAEEKMSAYVANGDPYMTLAVDRMLEGVHTSTNSSDH
ncbi:hypothetical protein [Devosia elaeis]|uniref:Capsule biosynthesis protein n=1 Tax=Devosia elaeis TaxID=1770058 RepID=A0A178I6F7_9HYPH|nr:hypothetical protein [Devosia elaeis]OAM81232.1 hypothetical protein A3840_01630 [Devosia elaeis]